MCRCGVDSESAIGSDSKFNIAHVIRKGRRGAGFINTCAALLFFKHPLGFGFNSGGVANLLGFVLNVGQGSEDIGGIFGGEVSSIDVATTEGFIHEVVADGFCLKKCVGPA